MQEIALPKEIDRAITWLRQRGWGDLTIHSLAVLGSEEWLRQVHHSRHCVELAGQVVDGSVAYVDTLTSQEGS